MLEGLRPSEGETADYTCWEARLLTARSSPKKHVQTLAAGDPHALLRDPGVVIPE